MIKSLSRARLAQYITRRPLFQVRQAKRSEATESESFYSSNYIHIDKALEFSNQEYLVYENPDDQAQRMVFLPLLALLLGVSFWCFKRAYHWRDRYKLSLPFYLFFGGYILHKSRMGLQQAAMCISKISLQPDGRTANLHLKKYLLFDRVLPVDIRFIRRPDETLVNNPYTSNKMAFPISVEDTAFLLPRKANIVDPEVLPVILNGNYITYRGQTHEPIIQ